MNTFGLGRNAPLNTFGLGKFLGIIISTWKDTIRFSVFIKSKLRKNVEL